MNDGRNSRGLFDSPVSVRKKEIVAITMNEYERQLDEGAFVMSHDEAIKMGFIHPDYEPDAVMLGFKEGE